MRGDGIVWEAIYNPDDFKDVTIFESDLFGATAANLHENDPNFINAEVRQVACSRPGVK